MVRSEGERTAGTWPLEKFDVDGQVARCCAPGTLNLTRIFIVDIGWQNPFRVCSLIGSIPRVARSSQPWALMRNPFGIEDLCKVQVAAALCRRTP